MINLRVFQIEVHVFHQRVWPQKYNQAIKKSKFNFVVEYPIRLSIKRTLTGKIINYFVR